MSKWQNEKIIKGNTKNGFSQWLNLLFTFEDAKKIMNAAAISTTGKTN